MSLSLTDNALYSSLTIMVHDVLGHSQIELFVDTLVEAVNVGKVGKLFLLVDHLLNLGIDFRDPARLNLDPFVTFSLQARVQLLQLGNLAVDTHEPFLVPNQINVLESDVSQTAVEIWIRAG